jgi:hypothetical protein
MLTTATLVGVLAGLLPAKAADPELLSLVMPDAKVLAGVNVTQAKASPMGVYVLGQIQAQSNAHLKEIATMTGFDPTRDVHEVLVATAGGPEVKTGLFTARGNFDTAAITKFATEKGVVTTAYNGVTILTEPKGTAGVAFLSPTIVVGGDIASVKAAIDRRTKAAPLPAEVSTRLGVLSAEQDAWVLTTVPPTSLAPNPGLPPIPGIGPQQGTNNAFTGIKYAQAGLKFGSNVVLKAQAQAATAQDATQIGDTIKLLASLAQLQSNADPKLLALTQSLQVTTSAGLLNVQVSMPQDELVALLKQGPRQAAPRSRQQRKM